MARELGVLRQLIILSPEWMRGDAGRVVAIVGLAHDTVDSINMTRDGGCPPEKGEEKQEEEEAETEEEEEEAEGAAAAAEALDNSVTNRAK